MKQCEWCLEEIKEDSGAGRPARFCKPQCATKFHNELKRMKKQQNILVSEALRLNENLARGGEMAALALRMIQGLLPCLASSHAVDISCANCGQKRLLLPETWDRCTFCLGTEWKIKPRNEDLRESKS